MQLTSLDMSAIERSLDGLAARQQAIAANIANINTPAYVKREVNFEDTLLEALDDAHKPSAGLYVGDPSEGAEITASHNNPLLTWHPETSLSSEGPQRLDGNRSSVEAEMSKMAYNAIKYNAVSGVISKEYQLLRTIAQAK